jgi:hypothetical protein
VIALVLAAALPFQVLWAWARPEDLGFVDPARTAVAYLARSIELRGDEAAVRRRLQPLRVPDGTPMIAVVRIEVTRGRRPALSASQRHAAATAIVEVVRPGARALQIDFDASVSERAFYGELLAELRAALPGTPLQITALASWCLGDRWIDALPIDEAIPMLFRMGPDAQAIRRRLDGGGDFASPLCRKSAGLSPDEPTPRLPAGRRLYWFHPRAWTARAQPR